MILEMAKRLLNLLMSEVIDERRGHVVINPKDDNKSAECREQYKERDCNEWLKFPTCKQ